jgi:hypothetical protein
MGFVVAVKGKNEIKVSEKAFENVFKQKGYVLKHSAQKVVKVDEAEIDEHEETKTEGEIDLDTIPISDMNKEQLMQYAKEHNIDTKGAKNVSDARRIIQAAKRKQTEE